MRSRAGFSAAPSTATPLDSSTSRAGSVTTSPPTVTRPSRTTSSAPRREATPAWARNLARRTLRSWRMDTELLQSALDDLGQPAFRARQVWAWAARGAHSYAEMTDLPAELRAQLGERVPFSALEVVHEAHARDGTVKTLFRTRRDGRPLEAVLMRYRDGR